MAKFCEECGNPMYTHCASCQKIICGKHAVTTADDVFCKACSDAQHSATAISNPGRRLGCCQVQPVPFLGNCDQDAFHKCAECDKLLCPIHQQQVDGMVLVVYCPECAREKGGSTAPSLLDAALRFLTGN